MVWPGAFWHWSLNAVVWGQVSVPKQQPVGERTLYALGLYHQCPSPYSELQLTPASPGRHPRGHQVNSVPGAHGVTALPWFPVLMKPCVHPPRVEFLFSPVLWQSAIKCCWPSKPDTLESPPPDAKPPGWGVWHAAQNFHSSGRASTV